MVYTQSEYNTMQTLSIQIKYNMLYNTASFVYSFKNEF